MNKMKRFLAASFAMVMIVGSTIVVSAEESAYRLPMCPNCQKGGMLELKTYYGKWEPTGKSRTCVHYPSGKDHEFKRKKFTDQQCNYCKVTATIEKLEFKWECNGHY